MGALGPVLILHFWLKPVLIFLFGRPRAVPYTFFSAPEASKSAPRGLQEAKGRLNRFLSPPSGLQERFWTHFGAILEPCWKHCGTILDRFWSDFGGQKRPESRAERLLERAPTRPTRWNQAANISNTNFQWTLDPKSQARRNARSDYIRPSASGAHAV